MTENEMLEVQTYIKQNPPKEFDIDCIEKAFTYPLLAFDKKSILQELKMLFCPVLKQHYTIKKPEKPDGKMFLFGLSYADRADHMQKFDKVANLFPQSTKIIPQKGICIQNLFYMPKVFFWAKKYKKVFAQNGLNRYIAYLLFDAYCQRKAIQKFDRQIQTKLFVCWCDVHFSDFIATQYFNKKNIPTATLQHGHFNIYSDMEKWAYINSPGKYFLCYGEYTASRAKCLGVKDGKMIALGMPEQIGMQLPKEMKTTDTKTFGVSLSFVSQQEENKTLLQLSGILCEKYGLKCCIRLHPSIKTEECNRYITSNMMICPKEPMDSFIQRCDFVILGTSDVYLTLISNLIPVFRYCNTKKQDRFEGVDWSTFSDPEEFFKLYNNFITDKNWMQENILAARQKISSKGNPTENYFNFLSELSTQYENGK